MNAIIEILLGSCAGSGIGSFIAYRIGARHGRRARTGAMCPCGHTINYHKGLKGACKMITSGPVHTTFIGEVVCDCQGYAGPELYKGVAFPELGDQ